MNRQWSFLTFFVALSAGLIPLQDNESAEWHVRRARLRCCIPNRPYGHDDEKTVTRAVSGKAIPLNLQTLQGTAETRSETVDVVKSGTTSRHTVTTVTTKRLHYVATKGKRFVLPVVQSGPIRLENPSATLYESGKFVLSGVLKHDGGPNGNLLGSRVTVRVRALSGTTPQTAVLLWENSVTTRVRRNHPATLYVPSPDLSLSAAHFREISLIELYVQYRKDR